jgi:hypothetical protein
VPDPMTVLDALAAHVLVQTLFSSRYAP